MLKRFQARASPLQYLVAPGLHDPVRRSVAQAAKAAETPQLLTHEDNPVDAQSVQSKMPEIRDNPPFDLDE